MVYISPLTAIMIEQQKKFLQKRIKAEFAGEAQADKSVVKRILQGDMQLLYISPENLLNNHKFIDQCCFHQITFRILIV